MFKKRPGRRAILSGWFCSLLVVTTAGATAALAVDRSGPEPVAADCIACHEESSGAHLRSCLVAQRGGALYDTEPATYAALAALNRELRPVNALPVELVFAEGRMTCLTCHGTDPHDGSITVIQNSESALCRACHMK